MWPRVDDIREGDLKMFSTNKDKAGRIKRSQDPRQIQGRAAEQAVTDWLKKNGYEIIERNYRRKTGEVDIISRKDECLCFTEVRSRSNSLMGSPALTVDSRKQRQIIRTSMFYLAEKKSIDMTVRFDVAAVIFGPKGPEIEYILSAFESGI